MAAKWTPAACRASATSSNSSIVRATGFSQKTWIPRRKASTQISAWRWKGPAMERRSGRTASSISAGWSQTSGSCPRSRHLDSSSCGSSSAAAVHTPATLTSVSGSPEST